jgi:hypothetical protein
MKPTTIATKSTADVQIDVGDVDLTSLPKYLTRPEAAKLVKEHFFPVSPRSLEAWPILTRRVNGKALHDTAEVVAVAKAMVAAAPLIRGGRRTSSSES